MINTPTEADRKRIERSPAPRRRMRLTAKQRLFLHGLRQGKSMFAAALEAGYARSVARNPTQMIIGPALREAIEAWYQELGISDRALGLV